MRNKFTIEVDLKRKKIMAEPLVTQHDDLTFVLRVYDDGMPYTIPAGTTYELISQRPDQKSYFVQGNKTGDNELTFDLGKSEVSVPGRVNATLQMKDVDGRVSSIPFHFKVLVDLATDYNLTSNEKTLMEKLVYDGPGIIAEAEQVTKDNKTRFLAAVDTVSSRDSSYPSPAHGDTVRVTGEAKTYRFVEGSGWVVTDQYNPTAIDNLSVQLAEKATKTEVEAKRDKSTLITEYDISDTLKQQITGNAPVLATIGDKAVTPKKATFFTTGKNLFDKSKAISGYYVNNTNGELLTSATYFATDYILVDGGQTYTTNRAGRTAFYDENKTFISGESPATATSYTFTTPANAKYVRTTGLPAELNTFQIEKGTTVTYYETFKEYIKKENLEKHPFSTVDIPSKSLKPEQMVFISLGKNLFDKDKATTSTLVSITNGTLSGSASYSTSDFMAVESGQTYVASKMRNMAFYDASGVFISGLNNSAYTANYQFTVPSNATLVRISYLTTDASVLQVEKGNAATSYEPYQFQIPNLVTASDVDLVKNLVNIPSTIHALTTYESDVYFENIMNKSKEKDIDVVCSRGKHFERRFNHLFDVVETRPITISSYKNGQIVGTKSANFSTKTPADITGNFKAVAIGDSTTAQDAEGWVKKVKDLMAADGVAEIEWVGTRGIAPNNHEGRSGWSTNDYITLSSKNDAQGNPVPNAFWNPNTSAFDFSYYMTQNGFSGLTHAFIHLGINDVFGISNDTDLKSGVSAILSRFDTMLNSVNAHEATIKRCVMLTIPPTDSQDRFGTYYGAEQTQWRYKRNYDYFVSELIKKYDNRTSEGIYLVATNVCYDVTTDINDAVHPNAAGYGKMGEQVYKFLKVVG